MMENEPTEYSNPYETAPTPHEEPPRPPQAISPNLSETASSGEVLISPPPPRQKNPWLMENKPESTPRNYLAYVPTPNQCPRCGAYTPKQHMSYVNPQTGQQKNGNGFLSILTMIISSCLAMVLGYLAVGLVIDLGISLLLSLTGHLNDPLYADLGFIGIPFGVAGSGMATVLYFLWRQKRLSEKYITLTHCECWQCKNEWTIRQEPRAKKLS